MLRDESRQLTDVQRPDRPAAVSPCGMPSPIARLRDLVATLIIDDFASSSSSTLRGIRSRRVDLLQVRLGQARGIGFVISIGSPKQLAPRTHHWLVGDPGNLPIVLGERKLIFHIGDSPGTPTAAWSLTSGYLRAASDRMRETPPRRSTAS